MKSPVIGTPTVESAYHTGDILLKIPSVALMQLSGRWAASMSLPDGSQLSSDGFQNRLSAWQWIETKAKLHWPSLWHNA